MNEHLKDRLGGPNLITVLFMVLSFLLFLVTLVVEIQSHVTLSDMGLLILVMVTVSVVPALGRFAYVWMTAENEENGQKREALRAERTSRVFKIAAAAVILMAVRLAMHLLGS